MSLSSHLYRRLFSMACDWERVHAVKLSEREQHLYKVEGYFFFFLFGHLGRDVDSDWTEAAAAATAVRSSLAFSTNTLNRLLRRRSYIGPSWGQYFLSTLSNLLLLHIMDISCYRFCAFFNYDQMHPLIFLNHSLDTISWSDVVFSSRARRAPAVYQAQNFLSFEKRTRRKNIFCVLLPRLRKSIFFLCFLRRKKNFPTISPGPGVARVRGREFLEGGINHPKNSAMAYSYEVSISLSSSMQLWNHTVINHKFIP